jgi:hypothetical protein
MPLPNVLFVFSFFTWLSIIMLVIFVESSNLLDHFNFFHAPSFVWAPFIIENCLSCPPMLFGALLIVEDFCISLALAP